jgi:cold shock CspA family protein
MALRGLSDENWKQWWLDCQRVGRRRIIERTLMKNEGATCVGTIRKVHHLSARGFCFIASDDGGADVFAHVRDFASPIGGIERGDPVSYVVTTDDRSGEPRARNIMLLPKEQFTGTVTAYSVGRGWIHRA